MEVLFAEGGVFTATPPLDEWVMSSRGVVGVLPTRIPIQAESDWDEEDWEDEDWDDDEDDASYDDEDDDDDDDDDDEEDWDDD